MTPQPNRQQRALMLNLYAEFAQSLPDCRMDELGTWRQDEQ